MICVCTYCPKPCLKTEIIQKNAKNVCANLPSLSKPILTLGPNELSQQQKHVTTSCELYSTKDTSGDRLACGYKAWL